MANEEREEYPEAPMKRVPRGAEISPLDVFRTADPLQERIQKDATPKQTPRQKNKKTGGQNSVARSIETRLRGGDVYVNDGEDLAPSAPVNYQTHKIGVSKSIGAGQEFLVLMDGEKEKLLSNPMRFEEAKRETTNVAVDERTEDQKKRDELERIRRSEYRKATFPSAISASETHTGPGQISQEDATRAQYLAGELATDLVPGGRLKKGSGDFVKAALVPTPLNLAIGASHLVPGPAGKGLTWFLKGLKSTDDVLAAVDDPDAGGLAIAAGVFGGKKIPGLDRLKSTTKGLTREEKPSKTPFVSAGTRRVLGRLSETFGAQEAVAGSRRGR